MSFSFLFFSFYFFYMIASVCYVPVCDSTPESKGIKQQKIEIN